MSQQTFTVDYGITVETPASTIILGEVTPSSDPGMSSTSSVALVANSLGSLVSLTLTTDGNLLLPQDGTIYETDIPVGGLSGKTIALKPYGGTSADQQLLVYPTAGADANHLHLTSGNLWNTELFLGSDDLYVKLGNTGNVVINSNNGAGNSAQWIFGTAGTILNSGNLALQVSSGIPNSVSNWQGGGGWNQGAYNNLATTGGTGTGLTVNVAAGGSGYISIEQITINDPGTGYTNGDVITINNENDIPGTFVIGVSTPAWEFSEDGNLTTPGSGGDITMTGGDIVNANVVTANTFVGSGGNLTNVATTVTGGWVLNTGTNAANITVPQGGTYTIWVNGNIPNGIAVWNATVTVTNNNVPVIGQQFAWNYSGNALVITSIPNQIIGTAGAISNASPSVGTTTNVFQFSIDNNSGDPQTVNWGYTKLG